MLGRVLTQVCIGLMALFVIAKSIDFASAAQGRLKVNESVLPPMCEEDPFAARSHYQKRATAEKAQLPRQRWLALPFLPSLVDALEVGFKLA